jgi:Flp pilus assembly protein TadG
MRRLVQILLRWRPGVRGAESGQALVEFSLTVVPFLFLLMGVFDLGRGIYMMNGTAEAAREITRVTIVHPTDGAGYLGSGNLGLSPDTTAVIATQQGLIPGLTIAPTSDITCVDQYDVAIADANCKPGHFIKVRVTAPFAPITPIVSMFGSHTFESTSRMQIP